MLPRFTGEIEQIPPMYSAIKIGGKKLYELARRGEEVERKPRPVTIYELEVVEQTAPDAFTLRIRCSKGTYVRTLCHDIGRALGCGGCMSALRRTMAAGFTLADAVTLERVQLEGESLLQPVDSLFRAHPAYHIRTERAEALCRNGNPLAPPDAPADGLYRVYGRDGTFLCLQPGPERDADVPEKLFRSVKHLNHTVIALGFFDGVHRGHGALLSKTVERARELGVTPAVFTFDRPPKEVVTGKPVYLINSPEDRRGLIERIYGIHDVILAPFDQAMMTMRWEDYIRMLIRDYGAVHFVAGHDHHFGHKNEGSPELLQAKCRELGSAATSSQRWRSRASPSAPPISARSCRRATWSARRCFSAIRTA